MYSANTDWNSSATVMKLNRMERKDCPKCEYCITVQFKIEQQRTEWKKQVFTLELVTVITCSVNAALCTHFYYLECATSENYT